MPLTSFRPFWSVETTQHSPHENLLDLLVYTTNHLVGAIWGLFHLHELHQWVDLSFSLMEVHVAMGPLSTAPTLLGRILCKT